MSSAALDQTFAALADPTRRRVVELLRREPHRASDLADACDASRPAMSRHLRVLRGAKLVELAGGDDLDADQRERTYVLRTDRLDALRTWLDETDRFWSAQLASFADHVARKK